MAIVKRGMVLTGAAVMLLPLFHPILYPPAALSVVLCGAAMVCCGVMA